MESIHWTLSKWWSIVLTSHIPTQLSAVIKWMGSFLDRAGLEPWHGLVSAFLCNLWNCEPWKTLGRRSAFIGRISYFVALVTWFVFCWTLFYFVTFATVSAWFDEFIIIVFCIIAIDFTFMGAHCINFLSS